jgi:predicted ATP-dependent endonuclease of OLD family
LIIEKLIIKNYKLFQNFECDLNKDISILVGDNEEGKSTILEVINLLLTGKLNGRSIYYELTPYLCNKTAINDYISELETGAKNPPPDILLELYLQDNEQLLFLKGTNNSKKINAAGIYMHLEFNDKFSEEYLEYIDDSARVETIPIEYYDVTWCSFANETLTSRKIPVNTTLVDTSIQKNYYGTDQYISKIIDDSLDMKEKTDLSLNFRKLKESFAAEQTIKNINQKLSARKGIISDKDLSVSVDISAKSNWESTLTSYLDDIPFKFIGKGEQNSIKINLTIESEAEESQVILIEEPENHLSFSNMSKLINKIKDKCRGKQLILTTHSTFVLNKLGINNVILLNNENNMKLEDLSIETQRYFQKLPGYDTLRLILSQRPILVEGPSDELIIQKAYWQKYGRLPIEDGRDIITVRGLSFKRFLEIAKILNKKVSVVTDNDGDVENLKRKYVDYLDDRNIDIWYSDDVNAKTLEPQILKVNTAETLNNIFGTSKNKEELEKYMASNKTDSALKIFESELEIKIPEYINDAIE